MLRHLLVVVWIAIVAWGHATRRQSLLDAFVGGAATYMMFSNHTVPSRVLTTSALFVLIARTDRQVWLVFAVVWGHALLTAVTRLTRIDLVSTNQVHGVGYDTLEAIVVNLPVAVGMG